ncbi:hypothetical protein LTR44_000447 [Exophiala sp. CCFEE 6388]|uniref:Xylanolytic transcriptional activator regulatory domain-containing protein n=1 Tax=Exophiala sideris TaxID=1016849 RepID=A0ABR0JQS8_9EURO|nr:hypothetical protein LTR69_000448 [Exophiala sideris]KAK5187631.1 hypothetical protein LTR44_000447 [Eurotiomycetes sp. CCFEE 6388]
MAVVFTARYDGSGFYGSSSTVAFVDSVIQTAEQGAQTTDETDAVQRPESLSSRGTTKVFRGANDDTMEMSDGGLVLPGKRLADALLQCFWDVVHPLFPVLHKRTFLEAYEALWIRHSLQGESDGGREDEESNTYCMVNIVLALGAQFNKDFPPSQSARASNEFFQRSRRSLALDALDASTFAAVQTLVLTGIYLQSTNHATQCWKFVGLAIRAAQGLGLHLSDGPSSAPADASYKPDMDCQMTSRVWCCCLTLDRLVSMTFGRPFMIPNHSFVTMPPLLDERDGSENDEGVGIDCIPPYGCFVYSLQLFAILEDIMSVLYARVTTPVRARGQTVTPTNVPDLTQVLELDARLNDFHRDLPSFLKPRQWSPLAGDLATLQVNVLQVRYVLAPTLLPSAHNLLKYGSDRSRFLHMRILLLRPVLLVLMRTESGGVDDDQTIFRTALLRDMSLRMSEACVTTAHDMIDFLHERLDTVYRSACWYMVYFTFTSATVLIAAKLCPSLGVMSGLSRFQESWTKCQAILEYHKSQSQSASRGQQILRALDDRVSSLLMRSTGAPSKSQYISGASFANHSGTIPTSFSGGITQDQSCRDPFSEDWLLNDFATNLDFLDL